MKIGKGFGHGFHWGDHAKAQLVVEGNVRARTIDVDSKLSVGKDLNAETVEVGGKLEVRGKAKVNFFSSVERALMPDGIFVTHATGVFYTSNENINTNILKTLTDIFPFTDFYYEYIPSFSSLWGFAACSQKYSPQRLSPAVVAKRLKKRNLDSLSYYDKETHTRLFLLPKMFREIL